MFRKKTKASYIPDDDDDNSYKLHNLLSIRQICALKERFERHHNRHMPNHMFRKALLDVAHITMSDKNFDTLCTKLKYTGAVKDVYWEDFLTHLRVALDSEHLDEFSARLELPITGDPKVFKSFHRLPIIKMIFMPEIQNRQINHKYGVYVTCSRDGMVNYWSIDLKLERTVYSKSPKLKCQTWITDIVALPDVNVICTCSSERDLRFYDTTANKFDLRILITSFEEMLTTMFYVFYEDKTKESKLILGNTAGKVKLISIYTKDRGPFKSDPRMPLRETTYSQFIRGSIHGMKTTEIPTEHTDWVRQVAYYANIHCIISISTCSKQSMLIYSSKSVKQDNLSCRVSKGFSCFIIAEALHLIITGGPDCMVRAWNPFALARPVLILGGHHAEIVSITLQDDNKILISLDMEKCVRVWDFSDQICLQIYVELPPSLGEHTPICTYYNPYSRQLFVANNIITFFHVYPLLNGDYTDGVSHNKEISVILYNKLFKTITTCGFDSIIIIWNPWQGKRIQFIRDAHTYHMYGETVPVAITAAAFDPTQQFLITGASDGTLKIWHFIIKTCIRHMAITLNCEIFSIIWLPFRILVMGENRVVTEFADCQDIGSSNCKSWVQRHKDDILCSAMHPPHFLITGSYSGELVFWRMDTGQHSGMFNVSNPTERITVIKQRIPTIVKGKDIKSKMAFHALRKGKSSNFKLEKKETLQQRSSCFLKLSINVMISLTTRPVQSQTGTLLAALDDGIIQMWSIYAGGEYVTEFRANHGSYDFVISMCTDQKNMYLFTGHMAGYIKIWHLINFGIPKGDHVHVCMPALRLQFPFMWNDTILGRAKRAHRSKVPLLLNSFKAHLKPVTGLVYIDHVKIIVSCSSDNSARIWTLGGRYMGTLGTFKPWTNISPNYIATDTRKYTLPADIQRSASFTTLKVLNGGAVESLSSRKKVHDENITGTKNRIYGKRVDLDSILGKHFKLPVREFQHYDITLDKTLVEIPIYSEMIMQESEVIERPPTPELVKTLRADTRLTLARITP